ncbi:hypothetical protein WL61_23345 [Burkholderia ubonensis]|uniref:hypothetical protein n=1 Tax=Burkholderia ubonensis TaxID=101571 RepID=UPI000752FDC1|nr:hypothetical protein [Burkholderia ubonensis]KVR28655.1 hypothetical protein WK14_07250 [Burkholderia ubonensis]KWD17078.1 hypothetical protein WL61_23345 [Burkholderia ubonensis]KWD23659.1 hypothetical protein WL62_14210 [Burkholderia ubonensis]
MNISIEIRFTSRASREEEPNQRFEYQVGIPFPQVGDHITFEYASGPATFLVVDRDFSFKTGGVTIKLLMDLPDDQSAGNDSLETWKKLGQ